MRAIVTATAAVAILAAMAAPTFITAAQAPSFRSIMQELGRHMCVLSDAILRDDYRAIGDAARAIAEHPGPSDRELGRILQRLGPDAHQFEQADEEVHRTALALEQVARARNMAQVLRQHSALMQGCMSCHVPFRERLRSPAPS
jgi:cytochrome c556